MPCHRPAWPLLCGPIGHGSPGSALYRSRKVLELRAYKRRLSSKPSFMAAAICSAGHGALFKQLFREVFNHGPVGAIFNEVLCFRYKIPGYMWDLFFRMKRQQQVADMFIIAPGVPRAHTAGLEQALRLNSCQQAKNTFMQATNARA